MNQLMKQIVLVLVLASGFMLGACGVGSNRPTPTGKASIMAINAIHGSPSLNFLIEETTIGQVPYKGASTVASYDDLDFTFNFDTFFAGDTALTRIASQHIDFVANQHYTLVATGTIAAPVLTLWEETQRDFVDTDTVFQARFAHTSDQFGASSIDVYFALNGVAPVLGEQVATLNFGEISAPLDFEADDYVITITTGGDPADVLYTSRPTTVLPRTDLIITPFDGDANDTTSLVVRGFSAQGGAIAFRDPLALSTVQFLHAAMEMGTTDVYDDAALNSPILTSHAYRDLSADIDVAAGSYEYFYTPGGDTSVVSLDTMFTAAENLHYRVTAIGSGGVYSTTNNILDRRSISTAAKLLYFPATNNFDFTDLYVVDAGAGIDGQIPIRIGITSNVPIQALELAPGSFDLYITDFQDTAALAGPFRLDLARGDVIDMVAFDTIGNPAALDIVVYPLP